MEEEKVFNKRKLGLAAGWFMSLLLSLAFFWADGMTMGIVAIVISLCQAAVFLFTPWCYVFSRERLVIKYFFGLEESIPWQDVKSIWPGHVSPTRYSRLETFEFAYYSEEKRLFFMNGIVSKNRKTKRLMKKYCPQKFCRCLEL